MAAMTSRLRDYKQASEQPARWELSRAEIRRALTSALRRDPNNEDAKLGCQVYDALKWVKSRDFLDAYQQTLLEVKESRESDVTRIATSVINHFNRPEHFQFFDGFEGISISVSNGAVGPKPGEDEGGHLVSRADWGMARAAENTMIAKLDRQEPQETGYELCVRLLGYDDADFWWGHALNHWEYGERAPGRRHYSAAERKRVSRLTAKLAMSQLMPIGERVENVEAALPEDYNHAEHSVGPLSTPALANPSGEMSRPAAPQAAQ